MVKSIRSCNSKTFLCLSDVHTEELIVILLCSLSHNRAYHQQRTSYNAWPIYRRLLSDNTLRLLICVCGWGGGGAILRSGSRGRLHCMKRFVIFFNSAQQMSYRSIMNVSYRRLFIIVVSSCPSTFDTFR
jgi:hypothetical protein